METRINSPAGPPFTGAHSEPQLETRRAELLQRGMCPNDCGRMVCFAGDVMICSNCGTITYREEPQAPQKREAVQ